MEPLAYLYLAQEYEDSETGAFISGQAPTLLAASVPSKRLGRVAIGLSGLISATWGLGISEVALAQEYTVDYAGGGYYYVFDGSPDQPTVIVVKNVVHTTAKAPDSYRPVSPAPSSPSFCKVLKYGDSGEDVRCLQEQLRKAGYFHGEATGYFGSKTCDAVLAFQRDHGLVVDGVAGPQTLEALHAVTSGSVATPY